MKVYNTRKLLAEGILPKPAPTQESEALRTRLRALRLGFVADALPDLVSEAVRHNWTAAALLDALLRWELERQHERRLAQSVKISPLPTGQTMSHGDFAFQPSVQRHQIETVSTCAWIAAHQSFLLQGPPGVGNTHVAVAVATRAMEQGFSVSFDRTDELLHHLTRDRELPPERVKHRKYMAAMLLVIDELGFEPLTPDDANLFFRVVNDRYQKGAVCMTTTKGMSQWPAMVANDEALATAIVDRVLHASHVVTSQGRSFRLKDGEATRRERVMPGPQEAQETGALPSRQYLEES